MAMLSPIEFGRKVAVSASSHENNVCLSNITHLPLLQYYYATSFEAFHCPVRTYSISYLQEGFASSRYLMF